MKENIPYPYRMNITCTDEQRARAEQLIPWGMKDRILGKILDSTLDLLEKAEDAENKDLVIGAVLNGDLILSAGIGED